MLTGFTGGLSIIAVSELGDKTFFMAMYLAINNEPLSVTAGEILGHAICAAIAVCAGRAICGKISERTLTLMGGYLFILFGTLAIFK